MHSERMTIGKSCLLPSNDTPTSNTHQVSVDRGLTTQHSCNRSPGFPDGSGTSGFAWSFQQHGDHGVVRPHVDHVMASCMMLSEENTWVEAVMSGPPSDPAGDAFTTTALERHKDRLRDTTGQIVQQMLELRRRSIEQKPPTDEMYSRLLL